MVFPSSKTCLALRGAARDEIIAHCRNVYPKEACGLLAGIRGVGLTEPQRVVAQVYRMKNVEDSPVGYSMDPIEQLQTEKIIRQHQQWLAGIYHSHTATEAIPSPVDVSLAISPDISYVLVSLKDKTNPVIKAYRIVNGQIFREDLLIEGA
jgi:proteasome lid subunit RPN8/RPN11